MDSKTAEIRYGQWVQVIQDWSNSGLTKRGYCQEKGIDEKQFYYYQHRIRSLIAAQAEQQALPDGISSVVPDSAVTDRRASRPQIVKLQLPGMESGNRSMIRFSVNGMNLAVPENVPAFFLAKLLEAASHGSR